MHILVLFFAALPIVSGQAALWGQCGGTGWAGASTCVSGSCCTYSNPWYSQCLPCAGNGASSASSTILSTSVTSMTTSTSLSSTIMSTSVIKPVCSSVAVSITTSSTPIQQPTTTSSSPIQQPTTKSSTPIQQSTTTSSTPIQQPTTKSSTPIQQSTTTSSTPIQQPTTTSSTSIQQPTGSFSNPVIYEDFADNDISIGPDGAYYFSASNMHYSPGAPILRSLDLVNWEFVGHSVPTLAFGPQYNMTGGTAYDGGTWASTLRYRNSTGLWYWYGCVGFWNSYVYTAPAVAGPWTQAAVFDGPTCFYDCGLLIDDDDTMYIVYGSGNVQIAQLSSDGLSVAKTQQVFSTPSSFSNAIEGNRMYKRNGLYYVLDDSPGIATLIWKSSSPWGPWTEKTLIDNMAAPADLGGTVVQGSLIETPAGDWYFMSFAWSYPSGRLPVLAPITWGSDDYPVLTTVNGAWGDSYPNPLPTYPMASWTGTDTFPGTTLAVPWEWNHNPDPTKYTVNNGLTLFTATVTTDLYQARNTLTHRVYGPLSVATIVLDTSNMADGDSCGLAAFRDWSAYIGISCSGNTFTISNVQGLLQNSTDNWATITDGTMAASAGIAKGKVWLRGTMEAAATSAHTVSFQYSVDGNTFSALGGGYTLNTNYQYFIGYRWGIFNFATKALGGSILVSSFTMA